jgi:hypothetical protein
MLDPNTIEADVFESLAFFMKEQPRSKQAAEGRLGPSDIGFCRNKAALMTRGVPGTDRVSKWAAFVGTAIHKEVELALKQSHPDWLMGSIDDIEVTATLPSGVQVTGHPDIVIPEWNMVLDIKTVDGFSWVKREGTSLQHQYQRHLYAMGLIEAAILDDSKPVYVGNIYLDRSGKDSQPYATVEEMDPTLTVRIDDWIGDVIYAVRENEDAPRDIPAAVCERICSHFSACRGGLETHESGERIEDPELVKAVQLYVEARETAKEADALKKAAQNKLTGVNGTTGDYQVRWVEVGPSVVNAFEKQGFMRMDIRKVRR